MVSDNAIEVECALTHMMLQSLLPTAITSPKQLTLRLGALTCVAILCVSFLTTSAWALTLAPSPHRIATNTVSSTGAAQPLLRWNPRTHTFAPLAGGSGSQTPMTGPGLTPLQVREALQQNHGKNFLQLLHGTAPINIDEAHQTQPAMKMGVYLTANSAGRTDFFAATMDAVKAAGGDALVLEVKGGNVHFAASAPMAQKLDTVVPLFDLPAAVNAAHAKGLYVIARFVSVKDPLLAERDSATQIRNPVTGVSVGDVWTDPAAPDTLQYNKEILTDLLQSGVDEVNLDYIRYPTEYANAGIGLTGQQKADHLETFLKMARDTINAVHPQTKLGISTYAILGWDFAINEAALGQDFVRFAPLLDVISPMAYPSSFTSPDYYNPATNKGSRPYHLVFKTLTGYADLLGPTEAQKLRPWLQAYFLSPNQIKDEIQAVYDSGGCGFTFWSANNAYGNAYAAMKLAKDLRPERCR